jgi:EAL domain-containing protein (putative c-di-GMP-specific phosphodiesterase class I)/GGDEF domain-containing protein/CBS domain-containing protein
MLKSIMDFRSKAGPGQPPAPNAPDSPPTLSLFEAPHRQTVEGLLAAGGMISLLLFEIQDFYIYTKIYGPDIAASLSSVAREQLAALAEDRVQGLPLVVLERLDSDKFLLVLGSAGSDMDTLVRTGSLMRLNLRARLKREALNLTGQEIEIAFGAAQLPNGTRINLERAVHTALADAHRMIRGRLDPAGASLLKEFRAVLHQSGLRAVYQPIVDLAGGEIFAWEALARGPAGSAFESPSMLFGFAEEHDLVFPLERACRTAAISGFGDRAAGRMLFLNVHPRTLVDPSFSPGETLKLLESLGLEPHDVVIEITERHSTKDFSLFHRMLDHYRSEGYKVAVDDVGTGYSGLWSIAEIRPEFIKLDMSLVRGIDTNPVKRALIETFLTFSDKVGCKIIAEGIETPTELSSLVSMGVHYGQGYFLAHPAAPKPDIAPESAQLILGHKRRVNAELKCSSPIGSHSDDAVQVQAGSSVGELKRYFETHPRVSSVAVVSRRRPVGLVTRHQMDRVLSSQYGLALYTNRPVTKIMDGQPLIVDWNTPLEVAAQAAMNRDGYKIYDHVLVTREGRLAGLASVQKILDALAQVQMEMAKGANPLSGLPGNVAIESEIETRVKGESPVSFIYADLDNFKVYNDSYGFKAGDEVILLTSRIISWALRRHGAPHDFLGHVGGDDFVFCTTPDRAERICKAVTRCFARLVRGCYDEPDRSAGFILGKDRSGKPGQFPLMSISLAIVDCQGCCTLDSISHRSAEMKKYAKSRPGNVWVRDRRGSAGMTCSSNPTRLQICREQDTPEPSK